MNLDFEEALNRRQIIQEACDKANRAINTKDGVALSEAIGQLDGASIRALPIERLFSTLCDNGRFFSATLLLATINDTTRLHVQRLYDVMQSQIEIETGTVKIHDGMKLKMFKSSLKSDVEDDDDDSTATTKRTQSPPSEKHVHHMRQFFNEKLIVDHSIEYQDGMTFDQVYTMYDEWSSDRSDTLSKRAVRRCTAIIVRDLNLLIQENAGKQRRLAIRCDSSPKTMRIIREPPIVLPRQKDMSGREMMARDNGSYQYDDIIRPDDEIIFEDDADSEDVEDAMMQSVRLPIQKRRMLKRRKRPVFIDEEADESDADDDDS
jgi:hypothetical protein